MVRSYIRSFFHFFQWAVLSLIELFVHLITGLLVGPFVYSFVSVAGLLVALSVSSLMHFLVHSVDWACLDSTTLSFCFLGWFVVSYVSRLVWWLFGCLVPSFASTDKK